MAQAIYGRQNDEVVVVVEDNGETTDDKPFAVRLDFDHPERSLVEFKPGSNSRPENGESGSRRYWVCRVVREGNILYWIRPQDVRSVYQQICGRSQWGE